jgi:streptogramin lyase
MKNVTKSLAILSAVLAVGAVLSMLPTQSASAVSAAGAASRVVGDQAIAVAGSTNSVDQAGAAAGPNVDCNVAQGILGNLVTSCF